MSDNDDEAEMTALIDLLIDAAAECRRLETQARTTREHLDAASTTLFRRWKGRQP